MKNINTIEDAQRFLDKLTDVKGEINFENETGFLTRYFFKGSKGVMRSYTFGSGDDTKREKLTTDLILADSDLINKYFTDSLNCQEFNDNYGEF